MINTSSNSHEDSAVETQSNLTVAAREDIEKQKGTGLQQHDDGDDEEEDVEDRRQADRETKEGEGSGSDGFPEGGLEAWGW